MPLDITLPGQPLTATDRAMRPLSNADDADNADNADNGADCRAVLSEEVMAPLGPILVAAAGIGPGTRVLDVAAGSGNASLSAAHTGAAVVLTTPSPELLASSQARAEEEGLTLSCQMTTERALPFCDDEFDAVISAIGVMFAPDHRSAANELVRVCRPGGTIGVISWTLEGFFGQMLAAISPYRPSGPPRIPMSALWGREPYVRALLGNGVRVVGMRRGVLKVSRFDSAEAVHGYFKNHFGPVTEAFESIGDDTPLGAELDTQLIEIVRDYLTNGAMTWEYLLVTAIKRKTPTALSPAPAARRRAQGFLGVF